MLLKVVTKLMSFWFWEFNCFKFLQQNFMTFCTDKSTSIIPVSKPSLYPFVIRFLKNGKQKYVGCYLSLRKNCPYSDFFWSVFFRIQSKCGKIWTRKTRNTDIFHTACKKYHSQKQMSFFNHERSFGYFQKWLEV